MKIKILLLKDVAWVGWKWQIKEVSDTYARNVLIKQGLAKIADTKTIQDYEKILKKKNQQEFEIQEKKEFAMLDMKEKGLTIYVSSSNDWHLYEKINIKHIKSAIYSTYDINFDDKQIDFPEKKANKVWMYEFFIITNWKKISISLNVLTK